MIFFENVYNFVQIPNMGAIRKCGLAWTIICQENCYALKPQTPSYENFVEKCGLNFLNTKYEYKY